MMTDLEERERRTFSVDPRGEEEDICRRLKEEISRILAMQGAKASPATPVMKRDTPARGKDGVEGAAGNGSDKAKVLKVSWEKVGDDYTAQRLRELFEKFGKLEDVVMKNSKKRGLALVVIASKDAAFAVTGIVSGDVSNPLVVVPLQPAPMVHPAFPSAERTFDYEGLKLSNLVGAGYQAFEDSVLRKLQKAAQRQK